MIVVPFASFRNPEVIGGSEAIVNKNGFTLVFANDDDVELTDLRTK